MKLFLALLIALANKETPDTAKKPTLALEESMLSPMYILEIRDTASAEDSIGIVLGKDYKELFATINQNGLRPGKAMAFYYSSKPPFILDAAVEVDRFPRQTAGRIKINKTKGGNAVIVHYKGPYEQVGMAYTALNKWLTEFHKAADGSPFEIYLNDPTSERDPFELRTDVGIP